MKKTAVANHLTAGIRIYHQIIFQHLQRSLFQYDGYAVHGRHREIVKIRVMVLFSGGILPPFFYSFECHFAFLIIIFALLNK
ncbi:hypothetical protein C7B19_25970 [Escherichia coli]|nr:hypothetical protein C7B19_25970 [Escherichia coli]